MLQCDGLGGIATPPGLGCAVRHPAAAAAAAAGPRCRYPAGAVCTRRERAAAVSRQWHKAMCALAAAGPSILAVSIAISVFDFSHGRRAQGCLRCLRRAAVDQHPYPGAVQPDLPARHGWLA